MSFQLLIKTHQNYGKMCFKRTLMIVYESEYGYGLTLFICELSLSCTDYILP